MVSNVPILDIHMIRCMKNNTEEYETQIDMWIWKISQHEYQNTRFTVKYNAKYIILCPIYYYRVSDKMDMQICMGFAYIKVYIFLGAHRMAVYILQLIF